MMNEKPTKGGIIRRGQRKPYFKASREQIERRIEVAAVLGFCGFTKTEIHRVFREHYRVEWRQTDRYIMASAHTRAETHSHSTPTPPEPPP